MSSRTALQAEFNRVVVIGAGALGSLLAQKLVQLGATVERFDITPRVGVHYTDARAPNSELTIALQQADLVVAALPADVLCAALPRLCKAIHPDALLVETGSVKSVVQSVIETKGLEVETLGINPMFAPSIGFEGQAVCAVRFLPGPRSERFENCLRAWNASVVRLSAREHDQCVAVVQVATHAAILAFGTAISSAQVDMKDLLSIATPPFKVLLMLLSRLLGLGPSVCWDIQADNPLAPAAREALLRGLATCTQLTAVERDAPGFESWLRQLAQPLLPLTPLLATNADRLLSAAAALKL